MRVVAVIPARIGSTRFPGKVLADRTGKTLIQHVHERASLASRVDDVVVATDDDMIFAAVTAFGGTAIMTRADHPNGTSRLAEAAKGLDADVFVNVQGDEPELEPELVDLAIEALLTHEVCPMATLGSPFAPGEDPANPNIVKVFIDDRGVAVDFAREPVSQVAAAAGITPLKHVGIYVYRRDFLMHYVTLTPTPREQAERLEQLRVLEHGYEIAAAVGNAAYHGIDTPEQYAEFVKRATERLSD